MRRVVYHALHYISKYVYFCSLPEKKKGGINLRYMPTIANGHVGTTVYSKEMFLNGLFNGKGSTYFVTFYLQKNKEFKNRPILISEYLTFSDSPSN